MKIYYAFLRSNMERYSFVLASSRKHAAENFAYNKNIPLKEWLKIYTVYEFKECDKIANSVVKLTKDNKNIKYKWDFNSNFVKNIKETENVNFPTKLTKTNFIEMLKYIKGENWKINF